MCYLFPIFSFSLWELNARQSENFLEFLQHPFFLIALHLESLSDQENKNGFVDERCGFLHLEKLREAVRDSRARFHPS